jgi:hypothetical protein
MKPIIVAALVLLAPTLAYAHHHDDTRLSTRRQELPRVRTGVGGSGGATQPAKWDPPKQSASDPKNAASHGG